MKKRKKKGKRRKRNIMKMNETSILAVTNPLTLLAGGIAICLLGFFCARHYKDTNDFAKSVKLFKIGRASCRERV